MKLSETDLEHIEIASRLNKIGMIWIDKNILHKKTLLSDNEKAELRRHVNIVADIIAKKCF